MVQARPLASQTRARSRLRVHARVALIKLGYAVLLAIVLLAFLAPFVWMILNSLKTPLQISQTPPDLVFTPTLANYANVFGSQDFLTYMRNSAIVAGGSTLFALVLGLPAAYSIARYGQRTLSTAILVARIVPGITFLIPWFILFRQLHLVDTFLALILTHMLVGLPFIVWVMIPFFEAIPRELDEAARVDGCSIPSAFARVILPLSGPGDAALHRARPHSRSSQGIDRSRIIVERSTGRTWAVSPGATPARARAAPRGRRVR